jgi:Type II secretion system protein C
MRKPVYLAVSGISILVAAVSLGVTLTRFLGLRAYSPKAPPAAAAAPAGNTVATTPPEQWNNLFAPDQGMNLPSRLPTANAQSPSQAPRTAFVLVGTIVSSSPESRRAILWADGMKLPKAFREKEEVEPGALLSSIERDKVWISRGKAREKLDLLPVGSRGRPTTTEAPAGVPSVAATAPLTASPDRMPPLPGIAPAPPPARTQATISPEASSEDEELLSGRERRRRSREGRR